MTLNKEFVVITARSSSSRLRNKILFSINENTKVIDVIIERAKKIGKPIILATTVNKTDDNLVRYVKKNIKFQYLEVVQRIK